MQIISKTTYLLNGLSSWYKFDLNQIISGLNPRKNMNFKFYRRKSKPITWTSKEVMCLIDYICFTSPHIESYGFKLLMVSTEVGFLSSYFLHIAWPCPSKRVTSPTIVGHKGPQKLSQMGIMELHTGWKFLKNNHWETLHGHIQTHNRASSHHPEFSW